MNIKQQIGNLGEKQQWNHLYVLPGGIKTREVINSPGFNIDKWNRLEPIIKKIKLENKVVIDFGSSDGYFVFKFAEYGAKKSIGIEIDKNRIEKSLFVQSILKLKNVEFIECDLRDANLNLKADIVFALGLLHRVPDIYMVLQQFSFISDCIILEFKSWNSEDSILKWIGESKSNQYNKLYFLPTINCIKDILESLGFRHIHIFDDTKSSLKYKRPIVVAFKNESHL